MSINLIHKDFREIQLILSTSNFANPWMQSEFLNCILDYYNSSAWLIEHLHGETKVGVGILFIEIKNGKSVAYSGGRFGFEGFEIFDGEQCTHECLNRLISSLSESKFDGISIRWYSDVEIDVPSLNSMFDYSFQYRKVVRQYLVTQTETTISNGELIFPRARKRSNLTRNLNKSLQNEYVFRVSTEMRELELWFKNCHVKRMLELNSTGWDWIFFKNLAKSENSVLFLVLLNQEIVGGCFCIKSESELELIMMSSPGEFLEQGVNYFLTYQIYKWADENDIPKINWQGSNPPDGGVAKFKLDWNAEAKQIYLYCFKNDSLDDVEIKEIFPDRYIYPFESGKEGE